MENVKQSAVPLAGAESLDTIIITTKTRGWWALWAIAATVVVVFIWSVVATIPQQSTGVGIVSSYGYLTDVSAPAAGTVKLSKTSDSVRSGDVIGTVTAFGGGESVPVLAPVDGLISALYVNLGQGVEAGTRIAQVLSAPASASEIAVFTYLPATTALTFTPGEQASVVVTDPASSVTFQALATIQSVASTPSSVEAMTAFTNSAALANQWAEAAGGTPFRVVLSISETATSGVVAKLTPGAIVTIVNTYANPHPIDLLFGGN